MISATDTRGHEFNVRRVIKSILDIINSVK